MMFFCRILEALDLEEHPIRFHNRDGMTAVILMLSAEY